MATEVIMPKLGATMEGAIILQWYKGVGETVRRGEPVLEVQTDKINIDVEAEASGVLLKQLYEADAEVPVNTVIAYIGQQGEDIADAAQPNPPSVPAAAAAAVGGDRGGSESTPEPSVQTQAIMDRPRATPSARRLAQMHGVDLRMLHGSGPRNRIQKVDVEAYVSSRQQACAEARAPVADAAPPVAAVSPQTLREGKRVPVTGIRKVVGQRMAASAFSAPHVTLTSEINLAETVALRTRLLPVIEAQSGYRLSYTEIIIMAVAKALHRNPMLNASFQGDYIEVSEDVHVGMAVAIQHGLVVPVVRNADQKGLLQIVTECKALANAARENKLKLEQLSGGTFTVSNLGMYRVEAFTPIINEGETAILGAGRIVEKPIVKDGTIEVQPTMMLSLSFDHRVVDGAPAAQFLTDLCNTLEHPEQLIL